ncbi:MAG: CDP-2,3-bis-(O-geranylgeranyl)-sn-glycerol synthase [Thermoplasmata archaeon]|nr:CDP-2,3-bis-(O-geranylgeranyl)-sn-glycerol synthase [Candidatus Sysuiplasma acidicola]MBX8637675.1 CDP-2,3-bis-(O-geranylgeranyl)-sn-glycerol synthase [Candidatus Sysuiplasma acidicola]MBX8646335.1 CDP-2,3-bis-(O-geranylgeranyl)-sn-glycerol synthase [Candidatus Sysuiplasma acidicola]MDH2906318.1 CDP-2,3-bis-(O-geranylgeranyl)-sn-glycerol synthase [Methanomassiliicoccales archaeon]
MEPLWSVAEALWFFLPAMLPNTSAAIFGGGKPIDGGRMYHGKRLLGEGKTWRGLFVGISSGIAMGYLESIISIPLGRNLSSVYVPSLAILPVLIALSAGSMCGDLAGALWKRRRGMKRGEKAPILDQYDFTAGAFLLAIAVAPSYTFRYLIDGYAIYGFICVLLVIYPLHRLINYIGYRTGLKSVPW